MVPLKQWIHSNYFGSSCGARPSLGWPLGLAGRGMWCDTRDSCSHRRAPDRRLRARNGAAPRDPGHSLRRRLRYHRRGSPRGHQRSTPHRYNACLLPPLPLQRCSKIPQGCRMDMRRSKLFDLLGRNPDRSPAEASESTYVRMATRLGFTRPEPNTPCLPTRVRRRACRVAVG